MVASFLVGAEFVIQDRATAVLREITLQMDRLDALTKNTTASLQEFGKGVSVGNLTTRMKSLSEAMTGVAATASDLRYSFASDFESINAGLFSTVQMARELAVAMGEVGAAGIAMSRGVGGGMGGGGGGRGGGHGGFISGAGKAAGLGYLLSHPATMVAGYAGYEAVKSNLEENFAIAEAVGDLQIAKSQREAVMEQLRSVVQDTATGTIFSAAATAKFLPTFTSVAGPAFQNNPDKVAQVFPFLARTAELAELRGLGSGDDAIKAGIGYAHLTNKWEPEAVKSGVTGLYKTAKSAHVSMLEELKALKYVLPTAEIMGMDPEEATGIAGFMQISGMSGSTSGTAFNRMLLGLMKSGGPVNAHVDSQERQFENLLGGKSALHDITRGGDKNKHMAGLKSLSMVDASGNLVVLDQQGNIDMMKVLGNITDKASSMNRQKFSNAMLDAFGVYGERMAAYFADPDRLNMLKKYMSARTTALGPAEEQSFLAQSGLQKTEQMWGRMKDAATAFANMFGKMAEASGAVDGLTSLFTKITNLENSVTSKGFTKALGLDRETILRENEELYKVHPERANNLEHIEYLKKHPSSPLKIGGTHESAGRQHLSFNIDTMHVHANDPHSLANALMSLGTGSHGSGFSQSSFVNVG